MKSLVNNLMDEIQSLIEGQMNDEINIKINNLILNLHNKIKADSNDLDYVPFSRQYYNEVLNYWINYYNNKLRHLNNELNTSFKLCIILK